MAGGNQKQQEFDFENGNEIGYFQWKFESGEKTCEKFVERAQMLLSPDKIKKIRSGESQVPKEAAEGNYHYR